MWRAGPIELRGGGGRCRSKGRAPRLRLHTHTHARLAKGGRGGSEGERVILKPAFTIALKQRRNWEYLEKVGGGEGGRVDGTRFRRTVTQLPPPTGIRRGESSGDIVFRPSPASAYRRHLTRVYLLQTLFQRLNSVRGC